MKLKITIISSIMCLLLFTYNASAQWCGTSANGKFQWRIETKTTAPAQLIVTVHPLTLAGSTFINFYPTTLFGGGFGMTKSGTDWVFTQNGTYTSGAELKFYFLYNGTGVVGQEQSETFSYAIGQNCSASNIPPVVNITDFNSMNGLVSPETVLITATATDADGSISKVEFYNGATKIGEILKANASGDNYNFVWENVQPGNYSITAKAIDDKFGATMSDPFPFTITGQFTQEWCGTSVNGDYQWRAEKTGTSVKYTLHPTKAVTTASPYAIIYPYGVNMTKVVGTNDFTYTATGLTNGSVVSLYFTYNYYGGENNSSANKESYTVGNQCAKTLPVNFLDFNSKSQADGTVSLSWATASENDNNYFLLERSSDGINFTELTKVYSKNGNSPSRLDYQFTDKNPLSGNNYYKLSQYDNNGQSKELGLRVERVLVITQSSSIYPNPLNSSVFNVVLNDQISGEVNVSVSNSAGKEIYRKLTQVSSGSLRVELSFKPVNGLYLVKVGDSQAFKLLVE